ncbi:hypothetical protein G3G68_004867 [Salmonella enterica]|nr:hypothetical protein [Salmonella enterica]EDR4378309.1 hypothetical protein [Salmonella enterica]EEG5735447.1 hypothetical protein [Salmonella enterica]EEG6159296.1 hypothetical protein [Salmonella enterica]EEH7435610.1 hypothetical protein [Salmonella enterica]
MNIIRKKIVTAAAVCVLILYHTNATATTIDPSELSGESIINATTTVKQAIEPPTVGWNATPNIDTDVMDGAIIGAIRIEKIGGGHICVRTDSNGKYGGTFVMTNETGVKAGMTLEEVATIPRKMDPTIVYDTGACTESTNQNILMALKKYGDGMAAGTYKMNLYFAIWAK